MRKGGKGIAVAGSLQADLSYFIDTYPEPGLLTKIRKSVCDAGGSGNLILDLARLDGELPVKVSAVIGEDEHGWMLAEALSRYPNIDLGNITRQGESSVTIVMNAVDTRQRTFFFRPAGSDIYDETYIDWDKIEADIFHLEYLLLMERVDSEDDEYGTHGARVLHEAQRRGMKTSIDVVSEQGTRAERIVSASLKYTDYCSLNEIEAQAVTGVNFLKDGQVQERQIREAFRRLAEKGVAVWAVIHAPEWSYGYDCRQEQMVYLPSLRLPDGYIKGTTGAGDAYCSGILYGAYQGWGLEQAMKLGTACAACSLSEANGTDGMRSYEEVMEVWEKYRRTEK